MVATNTELVRRARSGDTAAFDLLLDAHVHRLYRIAALVLRDSDAAEDAVQEALVRCWRDLPALREPDRFEAWLNRLLVRSMADEGRRRRRSLAVVAVLRAEPAQSDVTTVVADRDELDRAFERLSVDHRTIVVLHHYAGLPLPEIAALLNIAPGTAKSRLHYAIGALRAAVEADGRAVSGVAI